jgi:L-ascorbate metabolism protein UlaG (beta-lactamase superfamily)
MVEIVYHGHSFVEIVLEQGSILIDPFVTGNKLCDVSIETITKKQILAICLTHGHSDHVGDTIALA